MKIKYENAKVYTGEGFADSFIVDTETGKFCEGAFDKAVDLGGKFVCAGFTDSHMHILNYGNMLSMARLADNTSSKKAMLEYFREYVADQEAKGLPKDGWILGRGFNNDYFSDDKSFPSRYDLDEVSTTHPICATRACGHICVVNSKALEVMGVDRNTAQPEGGRFNVDEKGEPTGQFFETATEMAYKALPERNKEDAKRFLLAACEKLNSYGITSCHSDDYETIASLDWHGFVEAVNELIAENKLTVRINEQAQFTNTEKLQQYIDEGGHKIKGEFFKSGPLKMLGDGSLGARTALLASGYADNPAVKGIGIYTQEEFDAMCDLANRNGMQIAIHAIGDGALDRVLNAYEKALKNCPRDDHRHGIVHFQITRPDQIEKMKENNFHVYLQSIFLDYDIHIVKERAGEKLASTSYQAKSLLTKGITLSNGSDGPVEEPVALRGIQCAVTRQDLKHSVDAYLPEEAFSVAEAIDSFTKGSAYAAFEENIKGQIKPGMLADFIVLNEDPFTVDKYSIKDIKVAETFVGGKSVYRA